MSGASKNGDAEIKSFAQLAEWLEEGCTPDEKDLRIGTENEKIVFRLETFEPPEYEGKNGIKALLERLQQYGWKPVYEDGNIIGLERGGANISLEPAGQFELSGAPLENLHETAMELDKHLAELEEVADELGLGLIGLGFHPLKKGDEMALMPKSRYKMLKDFVVGHNFPHALDIMCGTNTVQVNLGFKSEQDMVKKLRVSISLQPIVAAMFANSPFKGGKPSGYESYRSHILQNALGGRYGFMLPVAFEDGFGFERYADYALNEMPLLGVYKGPHFIGTHEASFKEFAEGKLDVCPGEKATMRNWADHLNTIWPEVRVRKFLEMRGADNGPAEMIKALPAIWTGLLYDDAALDQAYQMVKDWSQQDRDYLRTMTPQTGLQTPFRLPSGAKTTVQELAQKILALSEQGLKNRARQLGNLPDETSYLEPLHEIVSSGRTLSTRLVEAYNGPWKGDLSHLFNVHSYKAKPTIIKPAEARPEPASVQKPGKRAP